MSTFFAPQTIAADGASAAEPEDAQMQEFTGKTSAVRNVISQTDERFEPRNAAGEPSLSLRVVEHETSETAQIVLQGDTNLPDQKARLDSREAETSTRAPATARSTASRTPSVSLRVNGRSFHATREARVTLLDWLREDAGLTGAKKGCNEGACGACTVLVDGKRMNACLILLAQCDGQEITTVEGLEQPDGALHPVQQAFIDEDAFQCGYCTPGQVISAVACVAEGHTANEAEIREWMSGNLCRCSAYPQITAAVAAAARVRRSP